MRRALLVAVCILLGFSKSFAQNIYTYADDVTGAPYYTDPLLGSYTSLTAIGTTSASPCGYGFSGMSGWPTSVTYSSTGPAVQVTLTASAGHSLKVTGFKANLRRSTTGPNFARLAYSTDGVSWTDDGVDHVPYNGSCASPTGGGTALASWTSFCVSGTTLYFRIYAYDASGSGGTFQIYDSLNIIGAVLLTPTVPVVTPSGPTTFCAGGSVVLNASTGTGYTYQWYNGASAISGATNSSYTATTAGNYYVDLTSAGICSDTSLHTAVTVNPSPAAVIAAGGPTTFCAPGSVTLSETSGTGTTYQWYNTSGAIAGATNATYVASTTNRDSVVITNSYGCTGTSGAIVVTVNPTPTAVVTPAGPLSICSGSSVTLTASFGAGYTYQWYNGTGAIAGATNATHVVNAAGRDSVVVTAVGGCTATSNTVIVSLNPSPAPVVTASGPTTFCTPGSVTLTETSGSGTTYQWYNAAGAIAGATNASYTASATGRDSVKVTNSFGCSTTSAVTIVTANTTPTATVTPAGPISICSGSSSTLTASSGAGYTYQWYDGAGAIAGATNATHSVNAAGRDSVVITGAGGCTATSNTVIVAINPVPDATTTASGPLSFCQGGSVTLTATAGAGYLFQWRNTAGAIAGETNISYTATTPDTYHVRVTNSYGCAVNSITFVVTVNALPSTSVTASGPVTFCAGGNVVLTAEVVTGDVYQWYNAAGAIAGATNSSYTATTSDDIYCIVTNANSCSSTTVTTHVVEVAPPYLTAAGPTTFCSGGGVVLTASTSGASGVSYQWMRGGSNIAGATNSSYIATSTGSYTCLITISASCFSTTAAVNVVVRPAPSPIIYHDGHLHLSTATTFATYQWYLNTVTIPGATTYMITAHEIGSYTVLVTDTGSCIALSPALNIYELGVNNVNMAQQVSIYPNPATQELHISAPGNVKVVITSIEGKVMVSDENVTNLDISGLSAGVYIVMLYDEQGERLHVEKLIKE